MSHSDPATENNLADLTVADAARAAGTGRHLIRAKLQAGAFPNAGKDLQGFWRIPESDLAAAGLLAGAPTTESPSPSPDSASPTAATVEIAAVDAPSEDTERLQLEIIELRHRAERAEALLEAERRLSEERARALETERATTEALYLELSGGRPLMPKPRAPEPPTPRIDWQASMRAARERDARLRAARERESASSHPREEPAKRDSVTPGGSTIPTPPPESARRGIWRRR